MGVAKADFSSVDAMTKRWTEGTIIKISKVTFEGTVGASFIHTPMPVAIDLKRTTIHVMSEPALLMSGLEVASVALPPRTVAETSKSSYKVLIRFL